MSDDYQSVTLYVPKLTDFDANQFALERCLLLVYRQINFGTPVNELGFRSYIEVLDFEI